MTRRLLLTCLVASLLGCGGPGGTPFEWPLPEGVPLPSVPGDNPMTEEKVSLGRHLFFDQRLSGNRTQSCGSCHQQALAFSDGRVNAVGSTGEVHRRNTLALVNVAYNATLTWAQPELILLERQHLIPMFGEDPVELGLAGHEDRLLAELRAAPEYRDMFAAAFPGQRQPITLNNVVKALASFTRSLVSFNSPFDRYAYLQDDGALSDAALRGMQLFFSEQLECHHCHGGFNFSQSSTHENAALLERPFHNTGLYNVDDRGGYPESDRGLAEFTGKPRDEGRFRAPTLRNIALTAPYMHDGSIMTLEEVIDFYAAGGRCGDSGDGRTSPLKSNFVAGFELSEAQKQDLLAFLDSLTDATFISEPSLSDPFKGQADAADLSASHPAVGPDRRADRPSR